MCSPWVLIVFTLLDTARKQTPINATADIKTPETIDWDIRCLKNAITYLSRCNEIAIFFPVHDRSKNDTVVRQGAEFRLQFLEIKIVKQDKVYEFLRREGFEYFLSDGNPGRGILAHRNLPCQRCSFKAIATMLSISILLPL